MLHRRADSRRSADSHVRAVFSRDIEVQADKAIRAPFANFLNRPCIFNNTGGRIILTKTKAAIFGSVIVGALALPLIMQAGQPPKEHSRYKLIDLGTFGGTCRGSQIPSTYPGDGLLTTLFPMRDRQRESVG